MVYMCTVTASGRGRGYVVATGARTELGAIAQSIRRGAKADTPLQQWMSRFAAIVGIALAASSTLAFAIGLSMGQSPGRAVIAPAA